MSTLRADPELDRQLPADPHLLLLWRDAAWGRREGLLLVVGVCPFPGCRDRSVLVDGFLVPDTLRQVTCDAGDLRFDHHGGGGGARPGRAFGVAIGIDAGEVEVVDAVWDRRAVGWLEEALDGELRAALGRQFRLARARVDAVLLGAGWIDRELASADGVRRFPSLPEGAPVVDEGGVTYAAGGIPRTEPIPWQRFDDVIAGLRRGLAARGAARRLSPLRAPRVGRNDPCPCGSGRKYKRCCLGAA